MNSNEIPQFNLLSDIHNTLHDRGCRMCSLGFQPKLNGCCVSRGKFNTNKMIIGEAPGKEEDAQGLPFTGPAGELMDRIWESVGMKTSDWYITNIVKCRPIAEKGSGQENFTPRVEQKKKCQPYIDKEIELLKPKIIVTVGGVATAAMLDTTSVRIGDYRGRLLRNFTTRNMVNPPQFNTLLFPMLHPAALLHAKRDPLKHQEYRQLMWQDVQRLKEILEQEKI